MVKTEAEEYAKDRGRLEALRRYEILDTEPEEAFDRLVRLAAQLLDAPSSVISLVDEERQWFKARLGVDFAQTSLEESFCKHAICTTGVTVVPDATLDARFENYPNVVGDPEVRFYAGAPLITPEGHRLGTICVFSEEEREPLSASKVQALADLAGVVVDELELHRARRVLQGRVDREARLNQEISARKERLDLALEASSVGLWEWAPGRRAVRVDERSAEQLGVAPGDVGVGMFLRRFSEASQAELARIFNDQLSGESHARLGTLQVNRGDEHHPDQRWVVVYAARLSSAGEMRILGTLQDITDARNSQLEMDKLERLAAVGTMAAGVGHEINNPLAYILASMEFVQGMLEPLCARGESPVRLELEDVREALGAVNDAHEGALRMRDIVRELRVLARDQRDNQPLEPISVEESLNLALRMARIHLREKGRIELRRASNRLVPATRSGLTQVLLNVLLNAVHAVADASANPGDEMVSMAAGRIEVHTFDEGDQVVVEVEDNGVGIAAENLARVFDPFFTTKGPDEGTGLGLSTSLRLVESFGGRLKLTSELGVGTRVRLEFPAVEDGRATSSGPHKSVAPAQRRVLVIDDEARLGKMFVRLLRDQAEVLTVETVAEAWEVLEAGEVDVIFCDLHMPRTSGPMFHRELAQRYPKLAPRVVFMTGGLYSEESRQWVASTENVVLYKPFDLAKLREAMARVLERA